MKVLIYNDILKMQSGIPFKRIAWIGSIYNLEMTSDYAMGGSVCQTVLGSYSIIKS